MANVAEATVKVHFLGGLGEIGRNCMVLEQEGRLLVIDAGLMFPEPSMYGIDLILPDFAWLKERADRVDGIVLTHGHEDHTAAVLASRRLGTPLRCAVDDWIRSSPPHRGQDG